jgi:hypothetical protein
VENLKKTKADKGSNNGGDSSVSVRDIDVNGTYGVDEQPKNVSEKMIGGDTANTGEGKGDKDKEAADKDAKEKADKEAADKDAKEKDQG